MNPELQHILVNRFPVLFQDRDKHMTETCMCWGTEFGEGWYNIFSDLCEYLTHLTKQEMLLQTNKDTKDLNEKYISVKYPNIKFAQTKEKYGTLTIYWDILPLDNYEELVSQLKDQKELDDKLDKYCNRIQEAINYVEFLSSKTCEVCGQPGKLYTNGWYMTRCKKCIVEYYGFDPDKGKQVKF